jgi:hypothetical protein
VAEGQGPADEAVCVEQATRYDVFPDPTELDALIQKAGGSDRVLENGAYAGTAAELARYRKASEVSLESHGRVAQLVIGAKDVEEREEWLALTSERGKTAWMLSSQSRDIPCPTDA